MLHKLFKFKGGVKPDTNKTASVNAPIGIAPIPRRLIVPLHQSIGGKPSPLVEPGPRSEATQARVEMFWHPVRGLNPSLCGQS